MAWAAGPGFHYRFPPLSLTLFAFAPAAPRLALAPPPLGGGEFSLQLEGQPGRYRLETSTDLATWTEVATLTLSGSTTNLPQTVVDSAPHFWRAVWWP